MLPRKDHLKQINRLHNAYVNIDNILENEKIDTDIAFSMIKKHRKVITIWSQIDNLIESISNQLDELKITEDGNVSDI